MCLRMQQFNLSVISLIEYIHYIFSHLHLKYIHMIVWPLHNTYYSCFQKTVFTLFRFTWADHLILGLIFFPGNYDT